MSMEVEGSFVPVWKRLGHVNRRRYRAASRDEAIADQEKGVR